MSVFGYCSLASPVKNILCGTSERTLFFGGARIPLTVCRNIVLGEIKVVNLIEDWDVLEEYAWGKAGGSTSFSPTTKKSNASLTGKC